MEYQFQPLVSIHDVHDRCNDMAKKFWTVHTIETNPYLTYAAILFQRTDEDSQAVEEAYVHSRQGDAFEN